MQERKKLTVPLIPAYDPPAALPQVELHHGQEMVQRGVRYAGEWIVDGKLERAPQPLPMPWPEGADLGRGDRGGLFVSFGPVPLPDFIHVNVYGDTLDSDGNPVPEEPLVALECALSDPNGRPCIETRDGNVGVEVTVPPGGVRHVTAWASWSVPDDLGERLSIESRDVYAAWLFTVRT